jgi:hypothetical protein
MKTARNGSSSCLDKDPDPLPPKSRDPDPHKINRSQDFSK